MIVENTPNDLGTLCPEANREDVGIDFGIDLGTLFSSFDNDYEKFNETVKEEIRLARETIDQVTGAVDGMVSTMDTVEGRLWMIPGLLVALSVLSAAAMLGVLLAWKAKSGKKVQRVMTWFVLPGMVFLCIACWAVVVGMAIGSMVSSDMCTTSTENGSPDDTIQQILLNHGVDRNDTVFVMVNAYTNVRVFVEVEPFSCRTANISCLPFSYYSNAKA